MSQWDASKRRLFGVIIIALATGCSKRLSNKAAGEEEPQAYPLGYVEDSFKPRTQLEAFFTILQHPVRR
jgi:hypothetical protein